MSVNAIIWAKRLDVRPASKKLVLIILADWADDKHSCYPGQDFIAKECSMSSRSVRKYLSELEADGHIKRTARFREDGRGRTSDRIFLAADQPEDVFRRKIFPAEARDDQPEGQGTTNRKTSSGDTSGIRQVDTTDSSKNTFEEFWEAFPRKVGKGAARRAYTTALKTTDAATLLTAVKRIPKPEDIKFFPHPATWLNGERWLDDAGGGANNDSGGTIADILSRV